MPLWFVDAGASGAANGFTPESAMTTVGAAHTAASDGDTIRVISTTATQDVYAETLVITKNVSLIGPGSTFAKLTSATGDAISINDQVRLVRGFELTTTGTGDDCVNINAAATGVILEDLLITASIGDGITCAARATIRNCAVRNCASRGIVVNAIDEGLIEDTIIEGNTSDGIDFSAATSNDWTVRGSTIKGNGGWGIRDDNTSDLSVQDCHISDNTSGGVANLGTRTSVTGGLNTDGIGNIAFPARTELTAPPAATASIDDMIGWMFLYFRNHMTQTATTWLVKADDAATTVGTSTVSDDGTTFVRGEFS